MIEKRAIILAGGLGKRLHPYTLSMPKPMVPVNNKPILELIIIQLIKNNFNYITLCLGHQSHIIIDFIQRTKFNIKIDYVIEKKSLGTVGPLHLIKNLPSNFLLMNGDILTDLNYKKLFNKHTKNKNLFTINTYERKQFVDFGVLGINKKNQLINFKEKPTYKYLVSMGIYFSNKEILKYIPQNINFGFDQLMLKIIKRNKIRIESFLHKGYWLDIGRPDDYEQALLDYKDKL